MLPSFFLLVALSAPPQLQNPGFEASELLRGWTVDSPAQDKKNVEVRADSAEKKEGRQSLLIEARAPVHYSLNQWIVLPVGTLWRARVWIKTEGLSATGGNEEGSRILVDSREGVLGRSSPRSGASPWREEEVIFEAPTPEDVDIVLVGFENSLGKVWFDGLRLEPVARPVENEVRIFHQRLSKLPIDLKQCGQFIEPLCRLLPSMLAQQVESTSFEEEEEWWPSYKREIDKPHRPWYPEGAVHVAKYSLDTDNPYNGKRSQKIELTVPRARAGIAQDGFYLRKGMGYHLRLHMRGEGNVPVWASLSGDGSRVAGPVLLGRAGDSWQGAETVLRATRDVQNATLNIEFEGPGALWLDRIYMIDEDAVLGLWRRDVVAALKELTPGVIRFGGSSLEVFEWDKCIGSWDTRVPYTTMPWRGLEPNFVGVEEFVQLCQYVGAEPLICVRWTGKTPADAAAEVEYFNGGPETRWGKARAQNGHSAPYGVKYWQIGNEIGGPKYDASVRAFAEAIRKVDPTVKVLSSFPSADTLREGGGYLDYLCPHQYDCGDLWGKEAELKFLQDQIGRYGAGRNVRVAVTEWNTTAGQMGLTRGMLQTLGNALSCSRYQNLLQRYADLDEIAIRSNLVDSFGSGVLLPGPGWLYLAPTYYSQKMYTRSAGSFPLRIERTTSLPWYLEEPDLSVTLSENGNELRIYSVNSTAETKQLRFHLTDFPAGVKGGTAYVLKDRDAAGTPEVMNSRDDPRRIAPVTSPVALGGRDFDYAFEPFAVTLLELELAD
ncbi:MAG: alpha-L-arabinofuranosidase C-terminal domain-containing protein [Terriglobia bacterium]|jgi:alpha-N-arabinofuranosidase